MKTLSSTIITALFLSGLTACGEIDDEALQVSTDDAVFIAALEAPGPEGDSDWSEPTAEEPEVHNRCDLGAVRQRLISRYDTNNDGVIDDTEREQLQEDFGTRPPRGRFARIVRRHKLKRLRFIYDADNSRHLDESEKATLREDLEIRCENRRAMILERFDENENGVLDPAERDAFKDSVRERFQNKKEAMLERFDEDDNGSLSREERQAARRSIREERRAHRQELKAEFDTDENGHLSPEELANLRAFLRSKVRLEAQQETPED